MISSYKNVVVLGGTGFVGKALQRHVPDWIYLGTKDCDLKNVDDIINTLNKLKPDAVLHLAARVGGIKENRDNQAVFFDDNVLMNTNVIRAAHTCGIDRVLASLSTCAFPNKVNDYPFDESMFFAGPPAKTNFSYGFSKRMLHVQCLSYRNQFERNYSTFCPSNIYGPGDNFDLESSHFVAALVRKIHENAGDKMIMWGTGAPRRQQLYVDDLAKIIPVLLEKHNTDTPLIVSPNENLSIFEMCQIAVDQINPDIEFEFNFELDGQYRKDGSNNALLELIGDFDFTSFKDGVKATYEWYKTC
jgi:GDP-L-fucose synthase